MANNFNLEHRKLEQTRTIVDPSMIMTKKGKIWEYFRNYQTVNLINLEKNIKTNTILYQAPLFEIHGSNMMSCGNDICDEIYIDKNFLSNAENFDIINHQLTHETLHSTTRAKGLRFGINIEESNDNCRGINEAVTQVFADDIEGSELGPEDDYLYFIKNVMRVMKNTVGPNLLANQYLNNNRSFEERFNQITNNKFDDFAFIINNIYKLSKEKHYRKINKDEEDMLIAHQNIILEFTSVFVKKVAGTQPDVYSRIKNDFFNNNFLPSLKIEQLNKSETK